MAKSVPSGDKAGFFCAFSKTLKAKKTQAFEKTQGIFTKKLNGLEAFYPISIQKYEFYFFL